MGIDIVRAWKDDTYRQGLSAEELRLLPAHPSGELDLTDADLQLISGGQFGPNGFGASWFGGGLDSLAFVCEEVVFSVTNIRNIVHTSVHILNICVNFG